MGKELIGFGRGEIGEQEGIGDRERGSLGMVCGLQEILKGCVGCVVT